MSEMRNGKSGPETRKVWRYFDFHASDFDAIYTGRKGRWGTLMDRIFRKDMYWRLDRTLEECLAEPGASVLDVGCGSGRFAVPLAAGGAGRVLGIDFSERMVGIARRLARERGIEDRCEFRVADFLKDDIAERFSVVIAIGVFDYLADPLPFLQKMASKAEGKVVATFPRLWTWRAPVRKVRLAFGGCPVYFYTENRVRSLFARSGLNKVRVERMGKLHFAVGAHD